jgi:pimeloyl-ACP methyl ester carboxylesterase
MTTFALVHGAWHGSWAWDRLRPELESRGHRVLAPQLPCEDVDAGAKEYAQTIRLALGGEQDAVLVGHSLAGLSIPLVPARTLVFLAAYVPQPSRRLIDRHRDAFGPGFGASLVRDELDRSYWPDAEAAAHDFQYPPEAAALTRLLRRQAHKPSSEPSPLEALPDIPRAYIVCSSDCVIPPKFQRSLAREELGVEPIELDSGHSPMLTCPGELAEILDRLASS